jgi:hypothetical protein
MRGHLLPQLRSAAGQYALDLLPAAAAAAAAGITAQDSEGLQHKQQRDASARHGNQTSKPSVWSAVK